MSKLVPKTIGLPAETLEELDRRALFLNQCSYADRLARVPTGSQWRDITYATLVRHAISHWIEATRADYKAKRPLVAPRRRKRGGK